MEAEPHRPLIPGSKAPLHLMCPYTAGGSKLGHFLKEIVVTIEKEAQPGSELIDIQSTVHAQFNIGQSVSKSKGQFLNRGGSRLPNMVTTYTDGIPQRKMPCSKFKRITDET